MSRHASSQYKLKRAEEPSAAHDTTGYRLPTTDYWLLSTSSDSGAFSHDPKKICCTSIGAVLQWRRFFEAAVTSIKANLRRRSDAKPTGLESRWPGYRT